MIKFKLITTYQYLNALTNAIRLHFPVLSENASWSDKAALVILEEWTESQQVRKLCRYPFTGEKKMRLKSDVACSLAFFIESIEMPINSYLGNYLQKVFSEIHKTYS